MSAGPAFLAARPHPSLFPSAASFKRAQGQWERFMELLRDQLKAKVFILETAARSAQAVFISRLGMVYGKSYLYAHRQAFPEAAKLVEHWFRDREYRLYPFPQPLLFQGEVQVAKYQGQLLGAWSERRDLEILDRLSAVLRKSIFPLQWSSPIPRCLEDIFSPISDQIFLSYPRALEPYSEKLLRELARKPVAVSKAEMLQGVCRGLGVEGHVILPAGCPVTARRLRRTGCRVFLCDFSAWKNQPGFGCSWVLRIE